MSKKIRMSSERVVLAFDIERSGATSDYDTIAIGASIVDNNLCELDRYYCNCYFPSETKFEKRCYEQFWSKNLDTLESLKYSGEKSKAEREKEMIEGFQNFRSKWEKCAKEDKIDYYLVSDNNVYDGNFINELINKYIPSSLPIPYNASDKEYESFFETHSMAKGFLLANGIKGDWNVMDKIRGIYEIPESKIKHDHNPANDAYTIAHDAQILFDLGLGKYKKIVNQ
jgi:hypothetical protein